MSNFSFEGTLLQGLTLFVPPGPMVTFNPLSCFWNFANVGQLVSVQFGIIRVRSN